MPAISASTFIRLLTRSNHSKASINFDKLSLGFASGPAGATAGCGSLGVLAAAVASVRSAAILIAAIFEMAPRCSAFGSKPLLNRQLSFVCSNLDRR